MKKLLFIAAAFFFPAILQADPGDVGPVTVINTVRPQAHAFQYVVISSNVWVSTSAFNKNLSSSDVNLQHAMSTLDQLSGMTSGSTFYIQNTNVLQAGATFYVSSGTVQGPFAVLQDNDDTASGPMGIKTLFTTLGSLGTDNYHSTFLYGKIPDPMSNGGEFVITTTSQTLVLPGSFPERTLRPEIAMVVGGNQNGAPGAQSQYVALRATGNQNPEGTPQGDFVVLVGTNVSYQNLSIQPKASINQRFSLFDSHTKYSGFIASSTVINSVTWTLPSKDGISGNVLTTDGNSVLYFSTPTSSPVGSGASVYPSTAAALFPFGMSVSSIVYSSPIIKSIYLSAAAGICQANAGCATAAQYQTSVSSVDYVATTFQANTTEYWQANFTLPPNFYTSSTFTVQAVWTSTMAVTASFVIDMVAVDNQGAIDTAWGTAVSLTTSTAVSGVFNRSQESAAITPAGAVAPNQNLYVRLKRAGDVAGDVRFLGIRLYYLTSQLQEH